ncbi:response regulator [Tunturiibacter gelidoferens]|uniref:histidine kinase n=1 Tax=Tunturiibacter gelidiferens TaxID=3069689 RepID=A0A9X0QGT1_9BACT|nr:response regulator [Edaphobacter lichenicola]MBB5330168.1 signal transduction histidine kinase/CheY-like chemotaxis protein [Edaphobacter lichenicola]
MHILPLLGYLSLLTTFAVLLVAFLRVQRTNRDLTDQLSQAREQQHQHTLQLTHRSELDTLKDEFISTVSHELRTPLTSIRGALGLLSSGIIGDVDAKALNLLRIAVTNTDRLIRLINDILDLERMESGRAPLQIRRCSLRDLAQQAIDTMTAMADANTVHLALEPSTVAQAAYPEALFFDGDADRILQVLTNLLSNAIKFSPAASTVRIHTEAASDSILLKVVDEGRGIPSDKLDTIFDRFQQIEPSDARQKGGTGLGLAICRSIVQQHSGSIWAQRNLGPGTTLYMMLPRTSRASDVAVPSQLPPRGEGAILVCDDDAGIRTVVAEHLTRQGYTVVEANSGEQALILAAEHQVEAILLDLYMPGLSGWETLQRLRNNPVTANIPVVVLSVLSSTLRPQLTGDAQGWVQKPFNENLLFAELGRVLHQGEGPAYVLLVEDDEDLASVLAASFHDAAVHIDHAATRQQAIRQCITRPPDLLILDLTLPDGDGFSLVEWLRQQPTLRTMPLVVYSGREISETEMAKLRLGPTEFLTKAKVQPQEVEELVLSMVHRLRTKFSDLAAAGPAA